MSDTTPKRRGRPATGVAPQRYIRLTDHDWDMIAQAAKQAGISRSEFVRAAAIARAKRLLKQGGESDHLPR